MTSEKAIKNIQDIYDLVQDFNQNIQDVDVTKSLELENELLEIFNTNEITKNKPAIKSFIKFLISMKNKQ